MSDAQIPFHAQRDETAEKPEHPAVVRARLDIIETARTVRIKCLLGMVDPKTGEIQRKTAIDVLDGLKDVSDEALLAEVKRRAAAARKVDVPPKEG